MHSNQSNNPVEVLTDGTALKVLLQGDIVGYSSDDVLKKINNISSEIKKVVFVPDDLQNWDSSLILLVYNTVRIGKAKNVDVQINKLPKNLQELVNMAFAVDRKPEKGGKTMLSFLERIGRKIIGEFNIIGDVIGYIGEVFVGLLRFLSFRSIMRRVDFYAA